MQRLFVLLLLFLSLATCWTRTEGGGQGRSSRRGEELTNIMEELQQLRRAQDETVSLVKNVSLTLMSKISNLNRTLDSFNNTVEEYFQSLNKIFGHWATAFMPKKDKTKAAEMPVCQMRSCFEKIMLRQNTFNSIKVLSEIKGVTSQEGCSQLCELESKCAAVYYNQTTSLCKFLVNQHTHLEPRGRMVALWARSGRGFGKCPSDFTFKWGTSRYKFFRLRKTWRDADSWCRKRSGSKLAELTSAQEIQMIGQNGLARSIKYWLVGGIQKKGSKEPDSGWKWYRSNVSIPSPGFAWMRGQPDNSGNKEHALHAQFVWSGVMFNDLPETHVAPGFLCECIQLGY